MGTDFDAGLAWDVLARYDDPATPQFDAVLAAAGLDPETTRALRFWQRESVASVRHYAAHALPAVLGTLATANADARDATERAATAWRGAQPDVPREPALVVVLPEPPESGELTEQRRRTVAARLTQLG